MASAIRRATSVIGAKRKTVMKTKSKSIRTRLNTSVASPVQIQFENSLALRVIGQPNGVSLAARARARAENPLRNKRRPIYTALLLGPTSVGKTETVREAAYLTHGDRDAFIQINAAAYKEKHRISQLIGAPPGYVGYKDTSDPREEERKKQGLKDKSAKLSKENLIASRKGSSVAITYVLIDELEKAGDDFFDLLLSIFEDGVIDFGNNEEADFREVVFFLTGNVGAFEVARLARRIGFNQKPVTNEDIADTVQSSMNSVFKPEFLARIDEICVYNKLSRTDLLRVVGTEVERVKERILNDLPRGTAFELKVDGAAEEFILEQALEHGDNARDIRRTTDKLLTDCLGNELMKNSIPLGSLVEVTHEAEETALAFYMTEGAGKVSAADLVENATGKETGVSMQRAIERAQYEMKRGVVPVNRYLIHVPLAKNENPVEEAISLIGDIKSVYELEILKWSVGLKPSFVEAEVLMTAAFEPQIKRVYKNATIKLLLEGGTTASAQ
jgi:ATP-dependent Clp protease ATP-binding subunit ClpA